MIRMTGVTASCKEKLTGALEILVETTQDFTDSAYTSHQHRESILQTCDRLKSEMSVLLRISKVSRATRVEMNAKLRARCVVQFMSEMNFKLMIRTIRVVQIKSEISIQISINLSHNLGELYL